MGRSRETFSKKEREKKKLRKRKEKQLRKERRRALAEANRDNPGYMIAYVDSYGRITDTPPDPNEKVEIDPKLIPVSTPSKYELEQEMRLQGKVDYFNQSRGFGFIRIPNSNEKFFVHIHGTLTPIQEGDTVSFESMAGDRGMKAVEVRRI